MIISITVTISIITIIIIVALIFTFIIVKLLLLLLLLLFALSSLSSDIRKDLIVKLMEDAGRTPARNSETQKEAERKTYARGHPTPYCGATAHAVSAAPSCEAKAYATSNRKARERYKKDRT